MNWTMEKILRWGAYGLFLLFVMKPQPQPLVGFSPTLGTLLQGHSKHLLGEAGLFQIRAHQLILSSNALKLLDLLVQWGVLPPRPTSLSLVGLNEYLQAHLLRGAKERWEIDEGRLTFEQKQLLFEYCRELGFIDSNAVLLPQKVDYCVVMGASTGAMQLRLEMLFTGLKKGLVCNSVALLGSNRVLSSKLQEWKSLQVVLSSNPKVAKKWNPILEKVSERNEQNCLNILWEVASEDYFSQNELMPNVVTAIALEEGLSSPGLTWRPTTETSAIAFAKNIEPMSLFIGVEKPYLRLALNLVWGQLSQNSQSLEGVAAKLAGFQVIYNLEAAQPGLRPKVLLDEVARYVYTVNKIMLHLSQLPLHDSFE